jgi:hypothetical protein
MQGSYIFCLYSGTDFAARHRVVRWSAMHSCRAVHFDQGLFHPLVNSMNMLQSSSKFFTWILALAALSCLATQAHADSDSNVLMPGPVIERHAKFESNCGDCHKHFDKSAQPDLCKRCHKEVAADEYVKHGLHGLHTEKKACNECHHEHRGRDISLIEFDTKDFDHAKQTGFELKGGHLSKKVQCKNCHSPRNKYREVAKTCVGCHAKQDKHKGVLDKECQRCHEEQSWKALHFDHGKTRFNVMGKHIGVKCRACHTASSLKHAPRQCNECHKKDDKHKGNFGPKCATCHTDRDWKEILFDHDKATQYPLTGKHHEAKCESCHKGMLYKSKLKTDCYSCHKKDDKHKGQEGKKCESCHTPHSWKKAEFDHRMSRFALTGLHMLLACNKCHVSATFKDAKSDCWSCHEKQDIHMRCLGTDCETCHNTRNWRDWDFDHQKTRFKLLNRHAALQCVECHAAPVANKISQLPGCAVCHDTKDRHNGDYGRNCERCHSDLAWGNVKVGGVVFVNQNSSKRPSDRTASSK